MDLKKLIGKLHLWLGISSGLLVFIIAVTGAIYAFQEEIQALTQPYRHVAPLQQRMLLPSRLRSIADSVLPGKHIHAVMYKGRADAAQAIYYNEAPKYYFTVYLNPYTGTVQQVKDMESGFFPFILDGHFYLWLPEQLGQTVVASGTLIFVFMMFSGAYLWWKRKKGSKGQRFKIKWDAKWRRKNYDLHNVMGIYVLVVALVFAVTGLVWGFEWFSKGYYTLLSGGKKAVDYYDPLSDTTGIKSSQPFTAVDLVWQKMVKEHRDAETIEVHFPEHTSSPIAANANVDAGTYWKTDYRYFDQYTLKELSVTHRYGRHADAAGADVLMKMNYDLHTGAVLGLPGKILACLASLVVASLPVTGITIWWGRKNKKKKGEKSYGKPVELN